MGCYRIRIGGAGHLSFRSRRVSQTRRKGPVTVTSTSCVQRYPRTWSHGELDRQVDACARALVARGLARGDRVAILSLNRAELLIAYFAIMRAGFVAIPTNIKFPHETVAFVLSDAEVRFAFCDTVGRALLPKRMPVVDFDSTGSDGFAGFLDPGPFETI